ncbi:glutamate--cysteine ligase [Microbacterium sp. MPKO10]|uniref:glutamate--cysteine ligase n=1 Tax=Microbacterium sp. MPKO10 TaxID=2989818 RepID=UPI002235CFD2|nr:glutamate--cysteine ligase [Microbacterium sp. MPKO10]MCW4459329.1 glutamate--cysteine ligase [Microbacterium sp. MPKO10]
MTIEFARSARSSIGLEWELALVDEHTGQLANAAGDVLADLRRTDGREHAQIVSELLQNTVELVSGVHSRVSDAVDELRALLDELRTVAAARGVVPIGAGTHPFGQWFDQPVTDKERYHKLIERTQWWGRNMLIWGVHVHVGLDDVSKAMPTVAGMLRYFPHLLALSSSSPFWGGVDTGYASNRSLMFQQLPTAGLPYEQIRTWGDYERYVEDELATEIIEDQTEVRWDVRPSARWGTVEVRFCDSTSTPGELAAIAALVHCLVDDLSQRIDDGRPLPELQPWFVRENKWRAARYGLDATIIVDAEGTQRPVADDIAAHLDRLEPVARRLGCAAELTSIGDIISSGGSSTRQRRIADEAHGDLTAVVAHLARELKER